VKSEQTMQKQATPILLYDGDCGVCRRVAHWVETSARMTSGGTLIMLMPVGHDPEVLKRLNPGLDIWDAYATNYLIMPDASMKTGGEAVAEVLRILPNTKWFAWCFALSLSGFRPFQMLLNLAYVILDDIRPVFGCESCGIPSMWVRPFTTIGKWLRYAFGQQQGSHHVPNLTSRKANPRRLPGKTVMASKAK
jgi:predicted DCC family thiol-disulfide oxidoreductase YuxK